MEPQKKDVEKNKKIFSIKYKLLLTFGSLTVVSLVVLIFFAVTTARNVSINKVELQLEEKAIDSAQIVDIGIQKEIQYLQNISRLLLQDTKNNYFEKAKVLAKEAKDMGLIGLYIADANGILYLSNGKTLSVKDRDLFVSAINGKPFVSSPYKDRITGKMVLSITAPVYNENKKIIGMIGCDFYASLLNKYIKDIVVGKTGNCYIINNKGVAIAHPNYKVVENQKNMIEESKLKNELTSLSNFLQKALKSKKSEVSFYDYEARKYIASFAKIPTTGWSLIVKAPIEEFTGVIDAMRAKMIFIGIVTLFIMLIFITLVSRRVAKPLQKIAEALKNISEGDGDLTVRLPLISNDEVTEVSRYFNDTIEKINISIKSIMNSSDNMNTIGQTLAGNMTETASSINQISANIEGVKGQVLSQSSGVTETSATMEEIIRTIHNLDSGINTQIKSLQELMKIIDDSNVTTEETRNILSKNDELIAELVNESKQGQEVISESEQEVKNILEESGSLLDASSIIQNIASQTNLLAMNAAIEAAHAGDSGKGFAVVADEIRKLAEESSSQAKVITSALKKLSSEIEVVSKSSGNIGESFTSIFEKVNQVKARSAGIMRIAETRKEQSNKLLSFIEDVDNITKEVKDGSAEMLRGGEQVAKEMRNLDDLTHIITDSMNEMANGANQINNAVQEVSKLTQQNKESIKELSEEVDKFKV